MNGLDNNAGQEAIIVALNSLNHTVNEGFNTLNAKVDAMVANGKRQDADIVRLQERVGFQGKALAWSVSVITSVAIALQVAGLTAFATGIIG